MMQLTVTTSRHVDYVRKMLKSYAEACPVCDVSVEETEHSNGTATFYVGCTDAYDANVVKNIIALVIMDVALDESRDFNMEYVEPRILELLNDCNDINVEGTMRFWLKGYFFENTRNDVWRR